MLIHFAEGELHNRLAWQHLGSQLIHFVLFQFTSFPHMVGALYKKLETILKVVVVWVICICASLWKIGIRMNTSHPVSLVFLVEEEEETASNPKGSNNSSSIRAGREHLMWVLLQVGPSWFNNSQPHLDFYPRFLGTVEPRTTVGQISVIAN